jgi:hypothetical protein
MICVPRLRALKFQEPITLLVLVFGRVESLEKSSARFNGMTQLALNFYAPRQPFAPSSFVIKLLRKFAHFFVVIVTALRILTISIVLLALVVAQVVGLAVLALDPLLPVVLLHQVAQAVAAPLLVVAHQAAHLLVPPVVLVVQLLATLAQVVVLLALLAVARVVEAAHQAGRLAALALALVAAQAAVVVLNLLTSAGNILKRR